MVLHVTLVAVVAPRLAIRLAGRLPRSVRPLIVARLLAAALEFVTMWGWHLPAVHEWGRASGIGFALEQASFLVVGIWIRTVSLAPGAGLAGGPGLLGTITHVTLLGAILTLPTRSLHATCGGPDPTPLTGQALGGPLMIGIATPGYLLGGLIVLHHALREHTT